MFSVRFTRINDPAVVVLRSQGRNNWTPFAPTITGRRYKLCSFATFPFQVGLRWLLAVTSPLALPYTFNNHCIHLIRVIFILAAVCLFFLMCCWLAVICDIALPELLLEFVISCWHARQFECLSLHQRRLTPSLHFFIAWWYMMHIA